MDPERFETLLVHGRLATGEMSLEEVARREGARAVFVPEMAPPLSPTDDFRALVKLRALVQSFKPDIVDTHTAKAGFLGRQAVLLAGEPRPALVHTFHGHVLEGYFSPWKEKLFRRLETSLAQHTDLLIGVSKATVEDLIRLHIADPERLRAVPLGLDLTEFANLTIPDREAARASFQIGADEVLVSFAGRMASIKRIELLLGAVAKARAAGAPLRLFVAGDGELRSALEAQGRALGIGQVVTWMGHQSDLRPLAAASDIAALSSANEGTPVALIEAAAAAVPAVATAVGGVPEVVSHRESGILVDSGDLTGFAAGLGELASNPEQRAQYGLAARETVLKGYSVERLVTDMIEIYEQLAPPPSSSRDRRLADLPRGTDQQPSSSQALSSYSYCAAG